jgi:hypothetical protein
VAGVEYTYEEARQWLATHATDGVSIGRLKHQALRLGPSALPAMAEVLARGTAEEARGAFSVLWGNGARMESEGDSPEDYRLHVTFPDGTTRLVHPENVTAQDLEDPPGDDNGAALEEGVEELNRSWLSVMILAIVVVAMAAGAANTTGIPHIVCLVVAVGTGLLLLWSLVILFLLQTIVALTHRWRPRGDGDE